MNFSDAAHVMTTGEAARRLAVSEATIRGWARAGKLAHQRTMSGLRLFDRALIEAIAQRRRPQ